MWEIERLDLFRSFQDRDSNSKQACEISDLVHLDESYMLAFDTVIEESIAGILSIQGSPGTGKTRVLASIAFVLGPCEFGPLRGWTLISELVLLRYTL